MNKSIAERFLAQQLRKNNITGWVREYRFYEKRRWRFDFAFPEKDKMIAIECEGGVYSRGRHVRGKGFEDDCVKYNEATILGWRVLRATTAQVVDGQAIKWIERILR